MSIKKMLLVAAGAAVLTFGLPVSAQDAEDAVPTEETAVEEVDAAVAVPQPAPAPVIAQAATPAPAPVPVPAKAEPPKPGIEVKPYGAAQYRFRGRWYSQENVVASAADATKDSTVKGGAFDHLHLVGWYIGTNVKFDDNLSLQFQIGNDWGANEPVDWRSNNTTGGGYNINGSTSTPGTSSRVKFNNLYVHLANATWNPGYLYLSAGVVGLPTSGALDLLERSLSTGSYRDAIYQTWAATTNNSVIGLKIGAPIVKGGVKVGAELTTSVIENRTQAIVPKDDSKGNPSSWLFVFNAPIAAGDFKVTPELAAVTNRNYNQFAPDNDKGRHSDHEIIGGLLASYKVSPTLSLSASGAYGQISNGYSRTGAYASGNGDATWNGRTGTATGNPPTPPAPTDVYESKGWFAGAGGSLKAGPGTFALDVKYQNSFNDIDDTLANGQEIKENTSWGQIYIDPRYTIPIHPKFTIAPRYRVYVDNYGPKRGVTSKIEQRPELILTGTF